MGDPTQTPDLIKEPHTITFNNYQPVFAKKTNNHATLSNDVEGKLPN